MAKVEDFPTEFPTTPQESFDRVVRFLMKQRKQAKDCYTQECKYRIYELDGNILACAAGCLIPENKYNSDVEGSSVSSSKYWDCLNIPIPSFCPLLLSLQMIHDNFPFEYWMMEFKRVADKYDLDRSVCGEFE